MPVNRGRPEHPAASHRPDDNGVARTQSGGRSNRHNSPVRASRTFMGRVADWIRNNPFKVGVLLLAIGLVMAGIPYCPLLARTVVEIVGGCLIVLGVKHFYRQPDSLRA